MASYTSNLNLKKPALTDDALVTDLNDNSDKLDAAISAGSGAIAIVSVGNTHAAISSGQYVYVRQHGSLSEGLYTATTNIAANGTLSGSNLTAVSGGGLNSVYSALSDQIANKVDVRLVNSVPYETGRFECSTAQTIDGVTIPAYSVYDCKVYSHDGVGTVIRLSTGDTWSISGTSDGWAKCKALT